jgi:fructose-1,6-bisphosphatase/inositol monophosphatase family enzyme
MPRPTDAAAVGSAFRFHPDVLSTKTAGMFPDVDAVITVLRRVAAAEIVPRFRRLGRGDISEKRSPFDLVTTADVEAERRLSEALVGLVPGSAVVGEEGAEANPAVLLELAGEAPVWLLDPVDGTYNFTQGTPRFAVIVAYCHRGETLGGWILDPLTDVAVWAVRGRGAWRQDDATTTQIHVSRRRKVEEMCGTLGFRGEQRLTTMTGWADRPRPRKIVRSGCTGRDYMELGQGTLDFAHYRRLKPWDHAAGVLVHAEAGGVSRIVETGAPYRPAPRIVEATLLLAPNEDGWNNLRDTLDPRNGS